MQQYMTYVAVCDICSSMRHMWQYVTYVIVCGIYVASCNMYVAVSAAKNNLPHLHLPGIMLEACAATPG